MNLSFGFGALSLLLAIAPQAVKSHATAVRHCSTASGLRVFVRHTHTSADFGSFLTETSLLFTNSAGTTTTEYPDGNFFNLPSPTYGCTSTVVSDATCSDSTNSWVYFDLPATGSFTVNEHASTGFYMQSTCGLYPATVSSGPITDPPTRFPTRSPTKAPTNYPTKMFSDVPSDTPTLPNPVKKPSVYQSGSELESAWNMDEPQVEYTSSNNTFHLTYNTTTFFKDFVSDTHLNEEFYDTGCKTGNANTEKAITSGINGISMYSSQMDQDAGGILHLDFELEPAILTADSDLYTGYPNGTGTLELCVRAAIGFNGTADSNLTLQEQIDGGYREVNFIESLLTVNYDLNNDFAVLTINVAPKDKVTTTFAEDAYGLVAWLCNITTPDADYTDYEYTPTGLAAVTRSYPPEIDDTSTAFNQGALISVCVRPQDVAYAEGIVMQEITNFTWARTTGPLPVSQKAVEASSAADNLLTYYPDCDGLDFCRFSSILFADFYITTGSATGSGGAKTKFAGTRRRLGATSNNKGRALQEDGSASLFDVTVQLEITDEGPGALKTAGGVSLGFTTAIVAVAGSMLFF